MKNRKFSCSISLRIYSSFFLFGILFLAMAFIVTVIVYKTRGKALHIATVIDPSLKQLTELHNLILHSKIYSTSIVFLEDSKSERDSLLKIHNNTYPRVKVNLIELSGKWLSRENSDSLQVTLASFEKILARQKNLVQLVQDSADLSNSFRQSQAKHIIQYSIIPEIDAVTKNLYSIISNERLVRIEEEKVLEASFKKLSIIILSFIVSILFLGIILSKYLNAIIVRPINQIKAIVDDLANGVTNTASFPKGHDEIGKMVKAVNNLSARLEYTAFFAKNVGERNYNVPFEPLHDEDVLGNSLVAMRNNLKSLDESLSQAQHLARIGNWEWDFKSDKISWSDELYIIFGKQRTEFAPSFDTVINYIHPDDKEASIQQFDSCLKNHESFSLECRFIIDGVIKHIFVQVNVSVDTNGCLYKLFGIMQDVTERVQKEQELKRFNERFNSISEATNDLIWDWDLVTNEVWLNKNFYKAFNYQPQDGVPSLAVWTQRLHPEDREKIMQRSELMRSSGIDSWDDELRYLDSNGEWSIAQDRVFILKDENGKAVRVIGAIQDITARKKAEQETANSERRYRQIVETAQEGIWMIDENNLTVFVNKKNVRVA